MTIRNRRFDAGDLVIEVDIDPDTNVKTRTDYRTDPPTITTDTASPEERAEIREERQLARVDQALTDLKAYDRLVRGDYRQLTDPADLRPLVDRINDLVKLNRDLIRLVRGLAAEDEV